MNYIETCTNELSQNEHIFVTNTILDQQNPVNTLKIPSPIPSSPRTPPFFVVLTWPHRVSFLFLNSLWTDIHIIYYIHLSLAHHVWLFRVLCVCSFFVRAVDYTIVCIYYQIIILFFYWWMFELIYDWLVVNISQMIEI